MDEVIGVYTLYNSIQYLIHGLLQNPEKKLYKKISNTFFLSAMADGR